MIYQKAIGQLRHSETLGHPKHYSVGFQTRGLNSRIPTRPYHNILSQNVGELLVHLLVDFFARFDVLEILEQLEGAFSRSQFLERSRKKEGRSTGWCSNFVAIKNDQERSQPPFWTFSPLCYTFSAELTTKEGTRIIRIISIKRFFNQRLDVKNWLCKLRVLSIWVVSFRKDAVFESSNPVPQRTRDMGGKHNFFRFEDKFLTGNLFLHFDRTSSPPYGPETKTREGIVPTFGTSLTHPIVLVEENCCFVLNCLYALLELRK